MQAAPPSKRERQRANEVKVIISLFGDESQQKKTALRSGRSNKKDRARRHLQPIKQSNGQTVPPCTAKKNRAFFKQVFVVIFYRSTGAGNADIGGGKAPIGADITPKSADIVEKILAYIAQKGSITNSEAQTILGLKETRTKEILGSLVQQMVLDRIGKNKGTKYIKHGTVADEIEVAE